MTIPAWVITMGIPSAITGLLVWWLKKRMDAQEQRQIEREQNQEKLIIMMMNSTKANTVGITAIAKAVQRIPDAQCNGDMTAALVRMEEIALEQKEFLTEQGVKHIFDGQ